MADDNIIDLEICISSNRFTAVSASVSNAVSNWTSQQKLFQRWISLCWMMAWRFIIQQASTWLLRWPWLWGDLTSTCYHDVTEWRHCIGLSLYVCRIQCSATLSQRHRRNYPQSFRSTLAAAKFIATSWRSIMKANPDTLYRQRHRGMRRQPLQFQRRHCHTRRCPGESPTRRGPPKESLIISDCVRLLPDSLPAEVNGFVWSSSAFHINNNACHNDSPRLSVKWGRFGETRTLRNKTADKRGLILKKNKPVKCRLVSHSSVKRQYVDKSTTMAWQC